MPPLRRTKLAPGARVALIAPAGPFPVDDFERGSERLSRRYEVWADETIYARSGYFAGSDERRAQELQRALDDARVDAIVAARGGYGTTRLLDRLDLKALAMHPKLLVGFSDVTALHALWGRAGVGSLHASMVAGLGRCDDALFERWVRAVEGKDSGAVADLKALAPGRARGRLAGGNLAVLCALAGTAHAPALDDAVLFLEDVGERPYRVDRMLTTLRHAGWLSRVAAVALGAFTQAEPGEDGTTVEQVLAERLGNLGIPVVAGVPAGHVEDNLELPLGAIAVVDADAGTLCFEEVG